MKIATTPQVPTKILRRVVQLEAAECPDRIQKEGLRGEMMVVERQEVSAIAATPLVRVKPATLRRYSAPDWKRTASASCLVRSPWDSSSI